MGSICGKIVEIMREDNTYYEIFFSYIILIMFDSVSKKNLTLDSGETTFKFGFEYKTKNDCQWLSFGWCHKEPGEKDDYQWNEINWNI